MKKLNKFIHRKNKDSKPQKDKQQNDKQHEMSLKKLWRIIIWSIFSAILVTGILCGSFGLGWQSDRFQKSFEPNVLREFDKTHLVLDINSMQKEPGVSTDLGTLLINAYIIDALSTLSNKQGENQNTFESYRDFAIYKATEDWVDTGYMQPVVPDTNLAYKIVKNINLYDFVNKIFQFDLAVGHKFIQPVVEPGLFWILSKDGISHLLSSNWKEKDFYNFTSNLQKVYTGAQQTIFDNSMNQWFEKEISPTKGLVFTKWIDREAPADNFHLINNKVWFVNTQFTLIRNQINDIGDSNIFNSENVDFWRKNQNNLFQPIIPREFTQPNYQAGYLQSRVGAIFIYTIIPSALILSILATLAINLMWDETLENGDRKLKMKKFPNRKNGDSKKIQKTKQNRIES